MDDTTSPAPIPDEQPSQPPQPTQPTEPVALPSDPWAAAPQPPASRLRRSCLRPSSPSPIPRSRTATRTRRLRRQRVGHGRPRLGPHHGPVAAAQRHLAPAPGHRRGSSVDGASPSGDLVAFALAAGLVVGAAGAGAVVLATGRATTTRAPPRSARATAPPARPRRVGPARGPRAPSPPSPPRCCPASSRSRKGQAGEGSGIILDTEGHILTNNHVVVRGRRTAAS